MPQQIKKGIGHRASGIGNRNTASLIELNNLCFSVNSDKHILNNITLNISLGDFIVVLGGNGSGKSTLLKLLNRTYRHNVGEIIFKNKPIENYHSQKIKKNIVTITQNIADSLFVDLTVEENAKLIAINGNENDHSLVKYLSQFNPKLASNLKSKVSMLSGGEQQILAFALYLRQKPDLLLLDEHTSALDPKKAAQVMEFTHHYIQEHQITCLMTTHQLDYALKYGNRLLAIREGELAFEADAEQKKLLSMTDLLQYCY